MIKEVAGFKEGDIVRCITGTSGYAGGYNTGWDYEVGFDSFGDFGVLNTLGNVCSDGLLQGGGFYTEEDALEVRDEVAKTFKVISKHEEE